MAKARASKDNLDHREALAAFRQGLELLSEKVWRWLGSHELGVLNLQLAGVGAEPGLRNLCEVLRKRLDDAENLSCIPKREGSMRMKLVALALCVIGQTVQAHGGGLDKNGCHNDRKHGGYHCHRAPSLPASPASNAPAGARAQGIQQTQGRPTCFVGPKGGTYTITKSGRKNYGGC